MIMILVNLSVCFMLFIYCINEVFIAPKKRKKANEILLAEMNKRIALFQDIQDSIISALEPGDEK